MLQSLLLKDQDTGKKNTQTLGENKMGFVPTTHLNNTTTSLCIVTANILPTIVLQCPCAGCTFKIIKQEEGIGKQRLARPESKGTKHHKTRASLQYVTVYLLCRKRRKPYFNEQEEA